MFNFIDAPKESVGGTVQFHPPTKLMISEQHHMLIFCTESPRSVKEWGKYGYKLI